LPNLLLTPHIAGISPRYEDRAAELFAEFRQNLLGQHL
jgi:phosphoglycerate dehydrogenase-like enzyme